MCAPEEVGSGKNSEPYTVFSWKIVIPPFGSLLGNGMGSGAALYYSRI